MNERDLDNQTSNFVNQKPSYVNQSSFYVNQTNSVFELQDGGWTSNDYQNLQG